MLWVIIAQNLMKRRISDQKAKELFREKGVELFTGTVDANDFHIRYA
jgi:hypothetical protein